MQAKRKFRQIGATILALLLVFLAACTAIQVQTELVLDEDGSGTRIIRGLVAKDDYQDGYGSAYYYLKLHGDDLTAYLTDVYTDKVDGSEDWLTITVDDTDDAWEVIELSFEFTDFDDYVSKLEALAWDDEVEPAFLAPKLQENEDGTVSYIEPAATVTSIFKAIQVHLMGDDDAFDLDSTRDGEALNDGSADFDTLIDSGVEIIKPENGEAMLVKLGVGDMAAADFDGETFIYTGNYDGNGVPFDPNRTPELVLAYGFDNDLANAGKQDGDLTLGIGSSQTEAMFVDGIDGQAIYLDGTSYLASPNATYKYDELTLSFYLNVESYVETDTGANMILVPAGLGALGAGIIDLEYYASDDTDGTNFLAKMNSNDWMTQDLLFLDSFFLENHYDEWHHYTVVYDNEYDEFGNIDDAMVSIYVDGQLAARSRLTVAAGLPYSIGLFDDGSFGDPNGGFNIGGYYEAEIVKRGLNGMIDNLMIYDGALTEADINLLLYTVAVDKPYDPNAVETPDGIEPEETTTETTAEVTTGTTEAEVTTTEPLATEDDRGEPSEVNVALIVGIVAGVLILAGAGILIARKRR